MNITVQDDEKYMSKYRNRNSSKDKYSATSNPTGSAFTEYLTMVPGLLMCLMLLSVLVLDVFMPGMADMQYEVFPAVFTVMDYLVIAGGLLYIGVSAMSKDIRFEKTDVLFAAFAFLILLSTFVNGFNEITVHGVPYRYIGIFNMFAFMLIYMGVTRSVKRESFGKYILSGYLAAADLTGIAALLDMLTGAISAFHGKKELSAIFFNGNHYGYFLLMAVLIGLAYYLFDTKKSAAFGAASAVLNLVVLLINHSLGSIIALIIVLTGTGLLILIRDRAYSKKLAILTAAAIAVFIAALLISPALRKEFTGLAADLAAILRNTAEGSAGHRRLQMWTLTAGYIAEKPLLGYGCEGIAFMLYEAMKVSDPHCETLAYAAFYGIPAALLYAAGVTGVIITNIRRMDTNGVQQKAACMAAAGYFLSSFVGVGMFYTLPFFFIFLGLTLKR